MKTFKNILLILSNILLLPISLFTVFGGVWYLLPAIKETIIGEFIFGLGITDKILFWTIIISASLFLIITIVTMIFDKTISARFKNFFIHLNTWLMCLLAIGLSIATFIMVNPLVAEKVTINIPRKVGIGVLLGCLVLHHLFSNKILTLINRRIQAYETTKESNIVGRSSVVFTNFLKLFEILFPEMLVLGLLCYCVSFNIAIYFLIILVSTFIPMVGNIRCDINTRNEIKRKQEIEKDLLAQKVASYSKEGK